MVEVLGMVHMGGRGLLRGRWWSVGPKLIFDQMVAPVLEIVDGSLCINFKFIYITSNFKTSCLEDATYLCFTSSITVEGSQHSSHVFTSIIWDFLHAKPCRALQQSDRMI
jgi:hypothetical protein